MVSVYTVYTYYLFKQITNIFKSMDEVQEEEKSSGEWRSFCFKLNTNATKYFVQVGVLTGLIVFSTIMLVNEPDCQSQRNYSSLLMVCLGVFLPAPKMS